MAIKGMNIALKVEAPDFIKMEQAFKDLAMSDQKKILNAAFRKAVRPTVDQARANIVHSKTRNLYRSMGTMVPRYEVGIIIGARKMRPFRGFHGHLVEDGTVQRYYMTKKGNKHETGKMNPNAAYAGFLRKAVKATGNEAMNILSTEWYNAIDKFQRKHLK